MRKTSFILLLLFSASGFLVAEIQRTFKFSVIILDQRAGDPNLESAIDYQLHYEHESEVLRILANVGARSPLYQYEGPVPVVFFREETTENEEGEEIVVRIPLVQIDNSSIPRNAERVLFVLMPAGIDRFSYFPIDYSRSVLPLNHVMVVNLSDVDVAFTVERERPLTIAPGQSSIAERQDDNSFRFFMRLAVHDRRNNWEMITSGFHVAGPATRHLFLVHRYNFLQEWMVQRIQALDDIVPRPDESPVEIEEAPLDTAAPGADPPD